MAEFGTSGYPGSTVSVTLSEAFSGEGDEASDTDAWKVNVPAVCGVPTTSPLASRARPGGRDPPNTAQE
jgi:hypothetical protein